MTHSTTTLHSFTAPRATNKRGTHIAAGQTVYAVKHQRGGSTPRFFAWCYSNRDTAQEMVAMLDGGWTSESDMQANWYKSTDRLLPSDRQPDAARRRTTTPTD